MIKRFRFLFRFLTIRLLYTVQFFIRSNCVCYVDSQNDDEVLKMAQDEIGQLRLQIERLEDEVCLNIFQVMFMILPDNHALQPVNSKIRCALWPMLCFDKFCIIFFETR